MSYAQEFVTMKIAELKHKLKILQQLSESTEESSKDEKDQLLDQLNWWLKIEKELNEKH